jgi:hypothetical protein
VEGKANRAVIAFLAKALGTRKNKIEIVAGERGLDKIISIDGMSAEEVEKQIQVQVNPLRGEPPTGEPDAGDPHVRFGGGRGRELNRSFLPLSYKLITPSEWLVMQSIYA